MRRYAGIGLLVAGGIAVALALVLGRTSAESGDVVAVESALRPETTAFPAPTATSAPPTSPPSTGDTGAPRGDSQALATTPVPVGVRIASIGVDAPVMPYGVDGNGQMDVPDNVTDVAWYEYGPRPGEAGSAVLAAHVDLAGRGYGVFFDLRELDVGDTIIVIGADTTEYPFRVVARAAYDKDTLPLDVIFSREGPPVLTLITCGGGFSRGRYDSNVVVYAVPDDGSHRLRRSTL